MPSLRALGLGLAILAQLVAAKPLANRAVAAPDCKPSTITKPVGTTPTVPLTGGATELPPPAGALQYVAIGRGIQNYTCATATSVPVALGAIATLYDATSLAYSNLALLHAIPPLIVYMPLPSGYLANSGKQFDVLGHHYFDSAGTPTFDLSAVNKIGFMAKTAAVNAPATANKGPAKTGAVPWLDLNQKAGYNSQGVSQVYRVETAGGNQQVSCSVAGVMSIQYAAEYWFYL